MTVVRFRVDKGKGVGKLIRELSVKWPDEVDDAIKTVLLLVQNRAKSSMVRGKPRGRVYRRKSVVHRASAPGQPPAVDNSDLVDHIEIRHGRGWGEVFNEQKHALYMEYGTKVGGKWRVRPRPWLRPAFKGQTKVLRQEILRRVG